MFITFEGLDFSGKTTQAGRLVERLTVHSPYRHTTPPTIHFLREPGGTSIAERIRALLLDRQHTVMCAETELFLFSASRAQLVTEVIRPAVERGEIVVCDRFYDSTTAYQAYGRGLPLDEVQAVNRFATGGLRPDLTLFVDIPVDALERRLAGAGVGADRMESAGREFYERVRKGFLAIVAAEPDRVVRVDGDADRDTVGQDVWRRVVTRFPAYAVQPMDSGSSWTETRC